ncbi:MAG: helix-turn-helix transcriptional regulator [Ruminococcus sp.]|nr:helix-turn-helix transcriptional regulator [Ruminococcus sp.]
MHNHLYLYPNIANVRKGKFTQAQLAEQLGISQQEVSRYETGEVKAPINYIIDLASICKVSVDHILGHNTEASVLSDTEQHVLSLYNALTYENKIKAEERLLTLLETQ